MGSDGCIGFVVFAIFGGIIVTPIVAFIIGSRQRRRAAAEQQRLFDEQRHFRGLEITKLYEQLGADPQSPLVARNLRRLLDAAPTGYHHELTTDGGWFDRVAPYLTTLLQTNMGAAVAERYFHLFTFPAGYQQKPLTLLDRLLKNGKDDEQSVASFQRLAGPLLALSSPREVQWLYARALENVRERKGAPSSKALALFIGRHSYSATRPDRAPTLYDEQAIANDIAARIA